MKFLILIFIFVFRCFTSNALESKDLSSRLSEKTRKLTDEISNAYAHTALNDCKIYTPNNESTYTEWFPIEDLYEGQPKEFGARIRFFSMAPTDVHVLLSPKRITRPLYRDFGDDLIYHIGIGAAGNIRNNLSSSKLTNDLFYQETHYTPVLRIDEPNEVVIEIIEGGEIRVLLNNATLMQVQDPDPFRVKYFSFASWQIPHNYYYDCKQNNTLQLASSPAKDF